MNTLVLFGFVFCIVIVVAIGWTALSHRSVGVKPRSAIVRSLLASARSRALIAVGFAFVVVVALFVAGIAWPTLLGLPIGLAPALGGAVGLLFYAVSPPRAGAVDINSTRVASLMPRTTLSFVSKGGGAVFSIVVVATVALLVFTGVTASPDGSGRFRAIAFHLADRGSSAGPYAGWFYGIPLLAATLVLVAATALALWRVSTTPALPQRDYALVDVQWRRVSNRIILSIATTALLFQFGGAAYQSGLALRNAYIPGVAQWWNIVGHSVWITGLIAMIACLVSLILAIRWAFNLPGEVQARTAEAAGFPKREGAV